MSASTAGADTDASSARIPSQRRRASAHEPSDSGLPTVLMGLTVLSGIIDAVSYLGLGRLYLGKMTGNIVVLGISTAQVPGFSLSAPGTALLSFLVGAVLGGRLRTDLGHTKFRWVTVALALEASLLAASASTAGVAAADGSGLTETEILVLIMLLAMAMGLRNATVRKLAIPDMTTTLITLTLADVAADSFLAGRRNPRLNRRIGAVLSIFGGALLGGYLVFRYGLAVPLAVAAALATALAVGYPASCVWRARGRTRR
ncbi:uncharacterized membrane protein YoaK (UPF0700 family) [Saccharopolyspora lacisalsi]|uniref:Uncharacterized membrane protein YoaK (UPF0700 family) n=1 Tax=Halosaccharopolyspora lacisalsi TaxID=1000566 RepID=A0A839DQP1_9PSEU|nr:YoaK family protein [Halosaccharopolyspora lacisalsi]MBA8823059.1 uncharacterized membrane protein YoaK (UPF0700 family) [Halosaccharopolyspora lacisalsi]